MYKNAIKLHAFADVVHARQHTICMCGHVWHGNVRVLSAVLWFTERAPPQIACVCSSRRRVCMFSAHTHTRFVSQTQVNCSSVEHSPGSLVKFFLQVRIVFVAQHLRCA